MAMMSSGECQCSHWVKGVTDRPFTSVDDGFGGIVPSMALKRYIGCFVVLMTISREAAQSR